MTKAFLPTILEQKTIEVAELPVETLLPIRKAYRLYD